MAQRPVIGSKTMRRLVVIQGGKSSIPAPKTEISPMKMDASILVSESDREEIIWMIDWGWSDDQILHMLSHVERGSITAFRAHVTRGTYDNGVTNGTARRGVAR